MTIYQPSINYLKTKNILEKTTHVHPHEMQIIYILKYSNQSNEFNRVDWIVVKKHFKFLLRAQTIQIYTVLPMERFIAFLF